MATIEISAEHLERLKSDANKLTTAQDIIDNSNMPLETKCALYDLIRDGIISLEDIITTCEAQGEQINV